jgi:hypothetical protein
MSKVIEHTLDWLSVTHNRGFTMSLAAGTSAAATGRDASKPHVIDQRVSLRIGGQKVQARPEKYANT